MKVCEEFEEKVVKDIRITFSKYLENLKNKEKKNTRQFFSKKTNLENALISKKATRENLLT